MTATSSARQHFEAFVSDEMAADEPCARSAPLGGGQREQRQELDQPAADVRRQVQKEAKQFVNFAEALPKNDAGKVLKHHIRAALATR